MKSLLTFLTVLSIVLTSFKPENRIFEEHQHLSPDIEWLKDDIKEFSVNVDNIQPSYSFNIAFRYANGFAWNAARVIIKEISPSGKESISTHDLIVRDNEGNYIGDAGYDIWDSTHLIDNEKKYSEIGIYKYTISHDMPRDDFPWAMEIGLIIDKN